MRIATLSALVSVTLGAAFFVACSSSSGGGGTGGTPTVGGGAGGTLAGGAGGAGGTVSGGGGGSGATGGTSAGASCKGKCDSPDPQGSPECYCDKACESNGDCCSDYAKECPGTPPPPQVKLPTGCVIPKLDITCNPVTNEGCTGDGIACDFANPDGTPKADATKISCYKDSTVGPGQVCDIEKNLFCGPKHRCDGASKGKTGICKQFCCSSADCSGGTCKAFDAALGTIGVCEGGTPTDGGTDSGTGGTGGTTSDAATDATTD